MTFDHKRGAVLELIKAAAAGQVSVENAADAVMELTKASVDTQWLPSDAFPPWPFSSETK
jgi:hypothetical protein